MRSSTLGGAFPTAPPVTPDFSGTRPFMWPAATASPWRRRCISPALPGGDAAVRTGASVGPQGIAGAGICPAEAPYSLEHRCGGGRRQRQRRFRPHGAEGYRKRRGDRSAGGAAGRFFGLFGFLGFQPSSRLFADVLDTDGGYLVTDEEMHTKLPGVFAAGDIRKRASGR